MPDNAFNFLPIIFGGLTVILIDLERRLLSRWNTHYFLWGIKLWREKVAVKNAVFHLKSHPQIEAKVHSQVVSFFRVGSLARVLVKGVEFSPVRGKIVLDDISKVATVYCYVNWHVVAFALTIIGGAFSVEMRYGILSMVIWVGLCLWLYVWSKRLVLRGKAYPITKNEKG